MGDMIILNNKQILKGGISCLTFVSCVKNHWKVTKKSFVLTHAETGRMEKEEGKGENFFLAKIVEKNFMPFLQTLREDESFVLINAMGNGRRTVSIQKHRGQRGFAKIVARPLPSPIPG